MGADEEPPVLPARLVQHHARHLPLRRRRPVPGLLPRTEPSSTGCSGTRPTRTTRTSCARSRSTCWRPARLDRGSRAPAAVRVAACATRACSPPWEHPLPQAMARAWEALTGEALPPPSAAVPGQLRRLDGGNLARARGDPLDRLRARRPPRRARARRVRRGRGGLPRRKGARRLRCSTGATIDRQED